VKHRSVNKGISIHAIQQAREGPYNLRMILVPRKQRLFLGKEEERVDGGGVGGKEEEGKRKGKRRMKNERR
jgi:hypothetical protein